MLSNGYLRRGALATWDIACWTLGAAFVIGFRYSFRISEVQWEAALRYLVISWFLLLAVGMLTKFYRGRFLVGSFDEALGLALHFLGVAAITTITTPLINDALPRSLPVLAPPAALVGAAAGRWFYRALRDRDIEARRGSGRPVLVYGAGDAGRQVLRLTRSDRTLGLTVVGFIDDNPGKRHLRIHGVPVVGTGRSLTEVADAMAVATVVLAVPRASGKLIDRVQREASDAGLELLILPRLSDLTGGHVKPNDIRRVEIGDVLGRRPVETDISSIARYLSGKRVLITGAGGSIGSELARQVHRFGPSSLTLLDRDESALHAVQLAIYGHGLLDSPETVLADIRDRASLLSIFADVRPDIVFHAAALKHLPMLERFPAEGWKTNVLGTLNLLELSAQFGVERFVNISTDKAADATSVLGSTKRLAEQLTAWQSRATGLPYMSVRFGNVLGSRGSMLHTFNAQIAAGGPITVTHPDVTRYFMTIPEACQLVVQAGAMGGSGEVLVLEMGEPVRILDVAKRMISLSGASGIDIVFSGLRSGEKLHEVLFSDDESASSTGHPMIRSVSVSPIDPAELTDLARHAGD
ncbi:polysaccharide biosynthesis protein [Nocardioides hwasunensis]|uniref:Polysaccharide biosynthesis protein n=1 Tax=Nocardioides hwasunensis TaxID=397258 RepID=A0ABR8MKU3_9ACTN|nr:nucleoside-diphosphate sugar epimerase/dehydratase [Nocardioides hwasunensis]MBD3916647.1 polysaccharide biosynthesis protein [Nocardioides hwasunensis]